MAHTLKKMTKVRWGLQLTFLSPDLIECLGHLGFQWLFLDAEHQPLTPANCRELVRAADLAGLPCVVRVPETKATIIEGFLDIGVCGIVAPQVSSGLDVRALVAAMKFAPEGTRGSAARSRAANYGLTHTPAEYYRRANHATIAVALIETQSGIEHLDEIIAEPGLDYVAFGANDLGLSLGTDAGLADARVKALIEQGQSNVKLRGKPQLAIVADADQARNAAAAGATLIAVSDTALLAQATGAFRTAVGMP